MQQESLWKLIFDVKCNQSYFKLLIVSINYFAHWRLSMFILRQMKLALRCLVLEHDCNNAIHSILPKLVSDLFVTKPGFGVCSCSVWENVAVAKLIWRILTTC